MKKFEFMFKVDKEERRERRHRHEGEECSHLNMLEIENFIMRIHTKEKINQSDNPTQHTTWTRDMDTKLDINLSSQPLAPFLSLVPSRIFSLSSEMFRFRGRKRKKDQFRKRENRNKTNNQFRVVQIDEANKIRDPTDR